MKKILFSLFLLYVFISPTSAFALSKGDWISFGKYNGSPIIWRVFDESETGLMLISDKVLDTKQYDETSADWGNSALRIWLNCAETSSDENGFLCNDNFTSSEYDAIVSLERQYIANSADINDDTLGEAEHIYKNNPESDFWVNYDVAYKNKSTDKIFLPTVSDIQSIIKNSKFFGKNYHLAVPAKEIISNSYDFGMREGEPWHYWLMDSLSNSGENAFTRSVTRDSRISFQSSVDEWVGVRPMCCLEKGKFTFSGGDGSVKNPYVLSTDKGVYITCDTLNLTEGVPVSVQAYASAVGSEETIAKYINGNRVYTDSLTSVSGQNEVYYYILDADDNIVSKSNLISVFASESELKSVDSHYDNIFEMKKTDFKTIDLLSENTSENVTCGQFDRTLNSNFVTKITCKSDSESQVAQFKIENIIDSGQDNNSKIIGFDLFVNELKLIEAASETKKFLDISLNGDEKLTIEALFLTNNGLHSIITDALGNIVEQNKWYTFYLIYDFADNEFKYSLYITEKGAGFKNANLVLNSSVSGAFSDCFSKGISLEIFQVADKTITCFVDNLFVENLLSVCNISKYSRPGDKVNIGMYIAPGFTNAEIIYLGEEICVFDNGTGFYLLETEIPNNISEGIYPVILNAEYENIGIVSSQFNAVCVDNNMYTYIKTSDGRDYVYDVGGVDNMYMVGNKTETTNLNDIKNCFDISFPTGYQSNITYSFDQGASDDINDKSLKFRIDSLTDADGIACYMGVGTYNTGEISPRDSILKVEYDMKFSSSDFILSFVTKTGDTWDKSVQLLSGYGCEYFTDSNIKFEPDKWYTITGIYNLLFDKLDIYIDGAHLTEVLPKNSFENANVTQLRIICGSNEEGKNIFWIDNLTKEYIPQYGGIKDFNPFILKNESFTLRLNEKIPDTEAVSLSLYYANGEAAGTARFYIDENRNTNIIVTPFDSFDENKNVFLTMLAGGSVVDTLVFTPIKSTVETVSELLVSEDDNYVYALVSAEGEGEVGNLFLVSYDEGYKKIINIDVLGLIGCEVRTNFFVKIKKTDLDALYKVFVRSKTLQSIREKSLIYNDG